MNNTRVFCKSERIFMQCHAVAEYVVPRLQTLEPDFDYVLPKVTFLKDTVPKGRQWARKNTYYGQSLYGTDWPDRWLCEMAG